MPSVSSYNTAPQSQEHQHSVIRLSVALFILGLYLWQNSNSTFIWFSDPIILTAIVYMALSVSLSFLVKQNFFRLANLRSAAIFIDITALSIFMSFGGETTSPLCVIYYLLILNTGLQKISHELWLSTALSILGFCSVLYFNSFWSTHLYLGSGLLLGMAIVSFLISRRLHKPATRKEPIFTTQTSKLETKPELHHKVIQGHRKLLLITHDSTDRHLLQNYIDSWGIKIEVCSSAVRAFTELLNAENRGAGYGIVIVDSLNLDMDPIQLCKSLKADSVLHKIDLIHISPSHSSDYETQLLDTGYSKVLKTPLDKMILFDAIHATKPRAQENNNITQLINHYSSKDSSQQPSDILLATPDTTEQGNLKKILEQDGQRVYSVKNGSEALDALNTHQFDIIIIDFTMSDIKGMDVIRLYYYTYPSQDWVPFIALVDEATPEILSQCREAEVDAVLVRPIEKQKLLTTVADIATSRTKQNISTDSYIHSISSCNTRSDGSNQVLNIQTIRQLEHLSTSDEFLEQLITRFNDDMVHLLDILERSIDNNQYSEFMDQSHALRDSSCNMGADLLHRLSLQALQINQREFLKQAKQILDELHIAQSKTKYALHNYVIQRNNSTTEKE